MLIGERIKARRKELKMSAEELGARLGKDRSTIYRYEKGDIGNLPLDVLKPLSEVLQVDPSYLLGWDRCEETCSGNPAGDYANRNISEKQEALIAFARSVPDEKVDLILRVMKSILESD